MLFSTRSVLFSLPVLGSIVSAVDGASINCPGVLHSDNQYSACCVGGVLPSVVLSTCPGWPICTGSATTTVTSTPLSCATLIPVTATNYASLISSASSSLSASGTKYQTTLTGPITGAPSMSSATSAAAQSTSTGAAMGLKAEAGIVGGVLLAVAGLL